VCIVAGTMTLAEPATDVRGKLQMRTPTVLVIDDEKDLVEIVRYNLEKEHIHAITAFDGQSAVEIALRHHPDLIVLDLMMPGMSGLEVCRLLRSESKTADIPIIMLTARASETDRIIGLELGADDYVTKPFSPRELVARVRAVLRRVGGSKEKAKVVRRGKLLIDIDAREVKFDGKAITLTATEFRVLEFLASRPGRVVSRDAIIDAALGQGTAVMDRTIDVHITALRRKLAEGGELIETVRGFGYKFKSEGDA
jgi:two-component system, OmpR family, alkaline phosphatase synthesis response regulator PhoP